ncbi:acyltransferase family protein [Phytohalomonas tamaricis]|uniref:acyltransferase family protein n=1 Tax=Phytohalomonas tamaricis TaxID=2081032 RepID=UPI000D0BBCA4|nr:acyltransferase family protein [Phytohalomonas tamaricis]
MPSQLTPSNRIAWIDAAKGTCILLVVLYHTNLFIILPSELSSTLPSTLWNMVITAMKPLRMPLFFLISGFLVYSSIFSKSWRQVFRSRIGTLLWLYALWLIAHWGFELFLMEYGKPEAIYHGHPTPESITGLIWNALQGATGIWYLYALVIYFVICKTFKRWAILTLAILALAQCFNGQLSEKPYVQSLIENGIFFALGCYGRNFITYHFSSFNTKRFLFSSLLTAILIAIVMKYDLFYVPGIKLILACSMVVAAIDFFALLTKIFSLNILQNLGRLTLPIYVMHMFFILILAQYIVPNKFEEDTAFIISLLAPAIITLLISGLCLALYTILNKRQGQILFNFPSRAFLLCAKSPSA